MHFPDYFQRETVRQTIISAKNSLKTLILLSHPPFFMPIWGEKTSISTPNRHKKGGVA
jgi:hypothetical protein